jgi:diguanylate cyclase (GGDEF)-like protein/PAS domain S-box-containing protein
VKRWVSWTFLAAGAVAALVALRIPGVVAPVIVLDGLGIAAVVCVILAARRFRPRDPRAWQLIIAGLEVLVGGELVWDFGLRPHDILPAENAANLLYLSAYPFLLLGLLRLARARADRGDRDALADATIITAAALVPAWQFLVKPTLGVLDPSFDTILALVYPLLDLLLIGALARLLLTGDTRAPALWMLFGGLVTTLGADVAYVQLLPGGSEPVWLDFVWAVSYLMIGAAALHPSMLALSEPAAAHRPRFSRARIAVLGSALFVGPAVVISERIRGREVDAAVLGPVSALVAGVVLWRLVHAAGQADRAHRALRESEESFRSLVQHAGDVIALIERDGQFRYVSPAVSELLGQRPAEFVGTNILRHLHADDVEAASLILDRLVEQPGRTLIFEARVEHRDGRWRWLESTCSNHLDDPGVGGIVANIRDVTDRKRAEALMAGDALVLDMIARGESLATTLSELIRTLEAQAGVRCCIRVLSGSGDELRGCVAPSISPEFLEALERLPPPPGHEASSPEYHAAAWANAGPLDDPDPRWLQVRRLAAAQGLGRCRTVPIVASDSEQRLGTLSVYGSSGDEPDEHERDLVERSSALAAVAVDRAAAEDRLQHLALHDPLTGLPNRALVVDRLRQALHRLGRRPGAVAVLFLDLDRFKVINDSLGHQAGDQLLIAVGKRLAATVRPEDSVARLGGDEFVVICEQLTQDREAQALAQRIARALTDPLPLAQGEAVVSVSIGIAVARSRDSDPEHLLRDADVAMYRAKSRGGACCELFNRTMHTEAVVRLQVERALRRALDGNELRAYFQPQVHIPTRSEVAVEALIRWQRSGQGLVLPDEFIPVAEETGLIIPIGMWMIEQACAQAARWQTAGPDGRPVGVSVNLSARQLGRPELPTRIRDVLRDTNVSPGTLCLEVTESVFLDDVDAAAHALGALKDLGLRLAVDDFGTGYSSLTYLKRFPFDELKIDASFVSDLGHSRHDDAIVAAAIEMAHALGMVAAAEGVETEAQLVRLAELGCDLAQGFHLARPAPAERLNLGGLAVIQGYAASQPA